ncbi:hypothetical protein R6Z07M_011363 [Ovis aries]
MGTSVPWKRDPVRLPAPRSPAREEPCGRFRRYSRAGLPGVRRAGALSSLAPRREMSLQALSAREGRSARGLPAVFRTPGGTAPIPLFVGLMPCPVQMMAGCRAEFPAFALFVQRLSIAGCGAGHRERKGVGGFDRGQCKAPVELPFTMLTVLTDQDEFPVRTTVKYKCSLGKSCGSFLELINGKMKINEDTWFGSTFNYFCNKGYLAVDILVAYCCGRQPI